MIVTAHQPNFLPGRSVVAKVSISDMVIWLDTVQFTHGGWTNRNRMPDGSWLTVPIRHYTETGPINRVRIAETKPWRPKHARTLRQHYGAEADYLIAEIMRPYRLLVGLNLALLRVLFDGLDIDTPWVFQSHLDSGDAVRAVSEERVELLPISERLAMMVEELGGDTYLSGGSGRRYLDEDPFHARGIAVDYFNWPRSNECAVSLLCRPAPLVR